ncbi:glutamate racemase [Candidatus Saccharibacteria bacterium]|nr:glutamate racemase [Candidatus Saccharibacteria bacterium]
MQQRVKIGVFDSGVGGLSVVNAIRKELPQLEIIYKEDKKHVPYGTRSIDEIYSFVKPIFQSLIDEGCKAIVVACNTVTTNLISRLRDEFPVPMVGMEPMVKPAAAASKTGVIAVCATPRTLESQRYKWLKEQFAKNVRVTEPDCSDWAYMVETNRLNREKVAKIVEDSIGAGADQIVLGCTHYHWIEDQIKQIANGRAQVIQPEKPVIAQLRRVLTSLE